MNDFRRALLDAEQDMMEPTRIARARRRVAARLEAPSPEPSAWLPRWSPLIALVAVVASALLIYVVVEEPRGEEVAPMAEPALEREELPGEWPPEEPRPGMAVPPPPLPTAAPTAPSVTPSEETSGTLVAIAIGGTCRFIVDGKVEGTGSSIKLRVTLGRHAVTCMTADGVLGRETIEVADGKPGIASFRFP